MPAARIKCDLHLAGRRWRIVARHAQRLVAWRHPAIRLTVPPEERAWPRVREAAPVEAVRPQIGESRPVALEGKRVVPGLGAVADAGRDVARPGHQGVGWRVRRRNPDVLRAGRDHVDRDQQDDDRDEAGGDGPDAQADRGARGGQHLRRRCHAGAHRGRNRVDAGQRLRDRHGRRRAALRVVVQAREDQAIDGGGKVLDDEGGRRDGAARGAAEDPHAGEDLVEDQAERVEIGPRCDLTPLELLRRHVGGGAGQHLRAAQLGGDAGEAEVHDDDPAGAVEHDVRGLRSRCSARGRPMRLEREASPRRRRTPSK